MKQLILFLSVLLGITSNTLAQKTIKFQSGDEVEITADVYEIHSHLPIIMLFHQAGYSRGEYKEIAPKLNDAGFTCIAVDLRSGNYVNGTKNKTAASARKKDLGTSYLDAEPDMIAAVNYAIEHYGESVILLGSSYSASLALKVGRTNINVVGVAAFSPGEYFPKKLNLRQEIKGFKKSHFATSAKSEAEQVEVLINLNYEPVQFVPKAEGKHGAKALWEDNENHEEYWNALMTWLEGFKN